MNFIYIHHPAIANEHPFPQGPGILGLAAKAVMFNCASAVRVAKDRSPDALVVHAYYGARS